MRPLAILWSSEMQLDTAAGPDHETQSRTISPVVNKVNIQARYNPSAGSSPTSVTALIYSNVACMRGRAPLESGGSQPPTRLTAAGALRRHSAPNRTVIISHQACGATSILRAQEPVWWVPDRRRNSLSLCCTCASHAAVVVLHQNQFDCGEPDLGIAKHRLLDVMKCNCTIHVQV